MDLADVATQDSLEVAPDERVGDDERLLDLPVSDVTNRPVWTTTAGRPVTDAVATMLERTVLEQKGRRNDAEYRGQLRRKLGDR